MESKIFTVTQLSDALCHAWYYGLGVVHSIIEPGFLTQLQAVLYSQNYSRNDAVTKNVVQKIEHLSAQNAANVPELSVLRNATRELVQDHQYIYPALGKWEPEETFVIRYGKHDRISSHRDHMRHPYLIVVFNITGSCNFQILEQRDGPVIKEVVPKPGDLLIMRAPGLETGDTFKDNRPFHQVSGNLSDAPYRISVGFRAFTKEVTHG